MQTRQIAKLSVLVFLATMAVSAPAASARTDALDKPVYFIHGIQLDSRTDCNLWKPMIARFAEWSGVRSFDARTVGYYYRDRNCNTPIWKNGDHAKHYGGAFNAWHRGEGGHTNNVRIEHLGFHLAWDIYNRYSKQGKPVDVVAHSMGGLLIRYALMQTQLHNADFPPYLLVEDVVTMGTPHGGSKVPPALVIEDGQMAKGSTFLKRLERSGYLPMGRDGTDWLAMGSGDDGLVAAASAVGIAKDAAGNVISKYIGAQHKVIYTKADKIGHSDYYKSGAMGGTAQAFVSLGGPAGPFTLSNTAPWPVRLAWASILYGDV